MSESLSVLQYTDYRKYLKDFYLARKKSEKSYSFRKFSVDLGLKATNFLHLVIQKKRRLSIHTARQIADAMLMGALDKQYFLSLVSLHLADSFEDKTRCALELEKIRKKTKSRLSPDKYAYFTTWYLPVIREMLSLKGFVPNLNWISRHLKPRIPEEKVKEALQILERLKLVKCEDNKWTTTEKHLATDREVTHEIVSYYHKELLNLSIQALEHKQTDRDISALTMSISERQFERFRKKILKLHEELQQEVEDSHENPTIVAQFNSQIYKLTRKD